MKPKKKHITISVDESRFEELSRDAEALGMSRSNYINSLLTKANQLDDVPLEILYINEFFQECKHATISDQDKERLQKPIKNILAIKAGKEDSDEHVQGNKKKQQKKSR